ncbi:MAG: hypothetical protein QM771_17705 [Nitrospira sp.]
MKRYAHLSDTHLRNEVEKVAAFGKTEICPVPDTVAVREEKETGEAGAEKLVAPEGLSEELSGTVTEP